MVQKEKQMINNTEPAMYWENIIEFSISGRVFEVVKTE